MARKLRLLGILVFLSILLTSQAFAAGKLVTTVENLCVVPYYTDSYYGYVFAELSNTGDKPVQFNTGHLELFDPDGNSISSTDVYYCFPPVLQPGEKAYTYASSYVETKDKNFISDHMLSITGKGTISQKIVNLKSTGSYKQITDYYGTYDSLVAVIENNTEDVLSMCEVVFAVKDAEGNLLYVANSSWSGYNVGVMPGSSLEMRVQMGTDMTTYMKDNGIVPATVESIAYYTTSV